ncbi:hypothetical protein [Mitsuaria sp. GD03876]|uniref:response regulator transcription factor n=1 Tax=Mitsuaria sp. GD03876 TaxID=2975399 RepID=UPI002446BFA0|nr:hypothetical protein [Mitsuaria sp. GD03876]MDH0864614.1 hypothetical protein [Mitsuaria sp. GD03876]
MPTPPPADPSELRHDVRRDVGQDVDLASRRDARHPARARLLLVQALSVQPLAAVLEEAGYELLRAADPVAAVDGLAAGPALVLMDMALPELPELPDSPGLPGGGPVALLRRLAGAGVPVLTLSRPHASPLPDELRAAGAAECLVKPVRMSDLLARVESLLRPVPAASPAGPPPAPTTGMTVRERDGHCSWQTPQARALMAAYVAPPWSDHARLPPEVLAWLHREALRRRAGAPSSTLTIAPSARAPVGPAGPARRRLCFTLMPADASVVGEGHWLVGLCEVD